MELDINTRVKILKSLINKNGIQIENSVEIFSYNLAFPMQSKLKNRTSYLIKPPFNYTKRKKYNFRYNCSYLDLYKGNNYYSFINITDLSSSSREFAEEVIVELIREICSGINYTFLYLWVRSIIESFINLGYKVKVNECGVHLVFFPLLSDLESDDPDIIINLSWYPLKTEIKDNILNLSIFNNI